MRFGTREYWHAPSFTIATTRRFVDVVHDADLRFIEVLASKMAHMTAEDDRLSGKDEDDGLLLDDELRSFIKKSHIGVSQDCVDKLELAFSTFYLLNTLGHHAYWRSDSNVNVVGFRDLATQPASAAILKQWAKNLKQARKSTNPFAPNVTPTDVEGIDPSIWNSWWYVVFLSRCVSLIATGSSTVRWVEFNG